MNFCSELMGPSMISSILGTNFLIHHKGKQSDRDNLFVHHCETFPNPFNFVMIFGPIHLRVSPKKPAAPMSLSPGDVMDPICEDYADGGRDDQSVSQRKMWIPPTNYGKNDEEFGFTLISFFLQRRFGSAPNCSIVNSQSCGCVSSNKSQFLLEAAENKQKKSETMEGGTCKMSFHVITINSRPSLSCVPLVIVLEWESQLKWKHIAVSWLGFHFHYIEASVNKLKRQKIFRGQKCSGWVKWLNTVLYDKQERLDFLLGWKAHIVHIPDVLFQYIDAMIE